MQQNTLAEDIILKVNFFDKNTLVLPIIHPWFLTVYWRLAKTLMHLNSYLFIK